MRIKFALTSIGTLSCALALASSAMAQSQALQVTITSEGAPATDLPMADYQAFDEFGTAHPDIISQLSRDPQLLRSDSFLSAHGELKDFLDSHAEIRAAIESDPGDFLPLGRKGQSASHRVHRHEAKPAAESSSAAGATGAPAATSAGGAPPENSDAPSGVPAAGDMPN